MIAELKKIFHSTTKALEILYILEGIKPVARQGFYENELPAVKRFCKENNLSIELSPYKVVLLDENLGYSNKGIKVKPDDSRRGMFFAYISKNELLAVRANCLELNNRHKELGMVLGYPECCSAFFQKYEPLRSKVDNSYILPCLQDSKGTVFPFQNNIMKQNRDITLLSHFPCSFSCQESLNLANQHLEIIKKHDRNLANQFVKELKGSFEMKGRFIKFV